MPLPDLTSLHYGVSGAAGGDADGASVTPGAGFFSDFLRTRFWGVMPKPSRFSFLNPSLPRSFSVSSTYRF